MWIMLEKVRGLLHLWRNDWDMSICSFSKGHIDSVVTLANGESWRFTSFYGHPNPVDRMA